MTDKFDTSNIERYIKALEKIDVDGKRLPELQFYEAALVAYAIRVQYDGAIGHILAAEGLQAKDLELIHSAVSAVSGSVLNGITGSCVPLTQAIYWAAALGFEAGASARAHGLSMDASQRIIGATKANAKQSGELFDFSVGMNGDGLS